MLECCLLSFIQPEAYISHCYRDYSDSRKKTDIVLEKEFCITLVWSFIPIMSAPIPTLPPYTYFTVSILDTKASQHWLLDGHPYENTCNSVVCHGFYSRPEKLEFYKMPFPLLRQYCCCGPCPTITAVIPAEYILLMLHHLHYHRCLIPMHLTTTKQ